MASLSDTTADEAAKLSALPNVDADGGVYLTADRARETRKAILEALATLDAVHANTRSHHDRAVLKRRTDALRSPLGWLGRD